MFLHVGQQMIRKNANFVLCFRYKEDMRRSNRSDKSRPQPPEEDPAGTEDESIDSDVELELLASSGDECEVNSSGRDAPPPPPSSPVRPTGTEYVMRVQRRTFTVSRTLYKMKGQKYVGAWVPTWWRDTKGPTISGVTRSGTYPPNPFKEIDPPPGSPNWSDVSDDSEPASPTPPQQEEQRIEELMEELMEELEDVSSESSESGTSEGESEGETEEVIVSSDDEVILVSEARDSKTNTVGPSPALQSAPPHQQAGIIELDITSDDETSPVIAQEVAATPVVPALRRGVPRVVSMRVIDDELRQQLDAVRNSLLRLSTPAFETQHPPSVGPAQEPEPRRCRTLAIAPSASEAVIEVETPNPLKESIPESQPASPEAQRQPSPPREPISELRSIPAKVQLQPTPTASGEESWDSPPGTPTPQVVCHDEGPAEGRGTPGGNQAEAGEGAQPARRKRKTRRSKRGGAKKRRGNGASAAMATPPNGDAALEDLRRKLQSAQALPLSPPGAATARGDLSPVPGRSSAKLVLRLDPPPGHCFQCWEPGHKARKCPNRREWDFCRRCGRKDETVDTCPRCGEEHRRRIEQQYGEQRRQRQGVRQEFAATRREQQESDRGEEFSRRSFLYTRRGDGPSTSGTDSRGRPPPTTDDAGRARSSHAHVDQRSEERDRRETALEMMRLLASIPEGLRARVLEDLYGPPPSGKTS